MGFIKWIAVQQNVISGKMGRGVSQILIFSDKWGTVGKPISYFWMTKGGGGQDPPFLAALICEKPCYRKIINYSSMFCQLKVTNSIIGLLLNTHIWQGKYI